MDYRKILQAELDRRCLANEGYSLRAFARDLGVNPSFLSAVLRGRRNLSVTMAKRLAVGLRLNSDAQRYFGDLVAAEHAPTAKVRSDARARLDMAAWQTISRESFREMSDWYFLAVRQLIRVPGFSAQPAWIASRLGIAAEQAARAWATLTSRGLVEKDEAGRWVARGSWASPDGQPNADVRKFHGQILEKSREALESVPLTARSHTALVFPFHSAQLEEARTLLREFRRTFEDRLNRTAAAVPDRVYGLSMNLFPLDRSPSDP